MTHKILVADDDLDNRTIAKKVLEKAGYDVTIATDGLEVMDVASTENPDLILLDLSMPKMNGWETAKKLRQMPEMSQVLILAYTAHAMVGEELRAKVAGCDQYISKPCTPSELVGKVKGMLGDKKAAAGGKNL